MPGPRKVKRYKKIYRSANRMSPVKVILTVFAVISLAVLGWGLYDPVYNLVMNRNSVAVKTPDSVPPSGSEPGLQTSTPDPQPPVEPTDEPDPLGPEPADPDTQSSAAGTDSPGISSGPGAQPDSPDDTVDNPDPDSPVTEPDATVPEKPATAAVFLAKKLRNRNIRGVYMPDTVLLSASERQKFLSNLPDGINAVVFDLKNSVGVVNYKTTAAAALQGEAEAPDAPELRELVKELTARGLTPVGRIHVFKDPIAASVLRDSMVKYQGNDDWAWLDNAPDLGGKPWLNPYSREGWGYMYDILNEATSAGIQEIILDSVQFPVGFSLEFASYGPDSANITRTDILREFVKEFTAKAKAAGADVMVYMPATSVIGTDRERYGGNPVDFAQNGVALGVMPSLFGNAFGHEDFMLESPVLSPYETVNKTLGKIKGDIAGKRVAAFVQCYTAGNIDPLYNKEYTRAQVDDQLRALEQNSVNDYILYNPLGIYR